jgi:TusA-related sulfurtransferase
MTPVVVDARGLEPPEPFERAMEALADLPRGGELTLLLDRMPHPLLRMLDRDGYRHQAAFRDDGAVEIHIARP